MEVITIHHPYAPQQVPSEDMVLCLGFFDGVHCGHQAVIQAAKEEAIKRQLPLAVMTFNRSPLIINRSLHPDKMNYLTQLPEKIRLLAKNGVDKVYVVDYTSAFCQLSPQDFVDQYLVDLGAKVVVAGFDYTYGDKGTANMEKLATYAKGRFQIIEVPALNKGEKKIASQVIRKQLLSGDLEAANEGLGYQYFFKGTVINGFKRGRTLGYPTANIYTPASTLMPEVGVYLVQCEWQHRLYWGMASIGHNITFGDNNERTLEINLFDFNEEIYGEELTVFFYKYLRQEQKFASIEAMIDQLAHDKAKCQALAKNLEPYQK